jgi:trigger factor
MTVLLENNPFDVPEGMIANQLLYLKDNFSQRLKSQGMSLEMLGMNDEAFNSAYRDMAAQQVKGELLLDTIAQQENIVVEDAEVDEKIQAFADENNTPLEQVQKYFENDQAKISLKAQVLQQKVTKFLLDQATVTEVEPPEPENEEVGEADEKES